MMTRATLLALGTAFFLTACSNEDHADSQAENSLVTSLATNINYNADIDKAVSVFKMIDENDDVEHSIDMDALRTLAQREKEQFISALLSTLRKEDNEAYKAIEQMSLKAGYENIQAFENDGNAIYQAIAVMTLAKGEPDVYLEIFQASGPGLDKWREDKTYGDVARIAHSVPAALISADEPYYDNLVIDQGKLSPIGNEQIAKYNGFLALMPDVKELMKVIAGEDQMSKSAPNPDPTRLISSYIGNFSEQFPGQLDLITGSIGSYGFDTLEDFKTTGDRLIYGLAIADIKNDAPNDYINLMTISDEDLARVDAAERHQIGIMKSYTETELAFFNANRERIMSFGLWQ
jgi:hypothetical protein